MGVSTSSNVRSIVTDDEFGGFRITIPPSVRAWVGSAAVLLLWILVLGLNLLNLSSKPVASNWGGVKFFLIWVFLGVCFALFAGAGWLRRDTVIIEGKSLVLRKEFACLRKEQTFELSEVRNLRPAAPLDDTSRPSAHPRSRARSVAFDHQGRTYHFGVGLSEQEVMRLIKTIRTRFPIRDDWNEVEPLPVSR